LKERPAGLSDVQLSSEWADGEKLRLLEQRLAADAMREVCGGEVAYMDCLDVHLQNFVDIVRTIRERTAGCWRRELALVKRPLNERTVCGIARGPYAAYQTQKYTIENVHLIRTVAREIRDNMTCWRSGAAAIGDVADVGNMAN
jgi:hypothetical protein